MSLQSVWIINQYAGSPYHGMEYRHYYMAKALIKKGISVTIISGSQSHLFSNKPYVSKNFTNEQIDGINYWWIKIPNYQKSISIGRIWNMLQFMFKLRKFPTEQLPKPIAILVSSPSLFPIVVAKKWAKKLNAKLIFEIRDIWPLTLQELGNLSSYHPLILMMRYFEKYGYAQADKIASLLPTAKEYFRSSGMQENKFIYTPNGIDLNGAKIAENVDAKIKNLFPSKFIIGYAGTLGKANSLETLIETAHLMESNDKIHFVIVGKGDQEQVLKEKAKGLKNISFIPAVKKNQIPDLLNLFHVAYIGLKEEPLFRFGVSPNKLFDYMYAKKPIVYSVNSGNKPIEEAQCGLSVEAENPKAVAEAILKLYHLPEGERTLMGENARAYVLKYHSYDKIVEKMIGIWA